MERSDPNNAEVGWCPDLASSKSQIMKTLYATILALSLIFAGLAADAEENTLATRQWKFGMGPASGDQLNVNRSGILYTMGVAWGVQENLDLDVALRTANFEKAGESGAQFSELLFGTNY